MADALPLGIIAGRGALPHMLVEAAQEQGRIVVVAAVKGWGNEAEFDVPSEAFAIDHVGEFIEFFTSHSVSDIVMGGTVERPSFLSLRPDALGRQLLARVMVAALRGDDALLREVIAFAKDQGFNLVPADRLLPQNMALEKSYGAVEPSREDVAAATHGFELLDAVSGFDIGQAAIVAGQRVLAMEGPEGTDAMIARAGAHVQDGMRPVLVKAAKAVQTMDADIPAVGADTIKLMQTHQITGLALQAQGVLVLQQEQLISLANKHEIWVQGIARD